MNRQNRGQTDYNVHESNDGSSSPNKMRRKPRKHDHDTQGSILDQGELESSLNYNSRGIQGTKGTYQGHQVDPQQHPRRGKSLKRGRQKSWHRKLRNSTARETTNDDQESDIPGFYYDAEKKKYFKILPNHDCAASGSITEEVIKKISVEKKRQKDLTEFFKPRTNKYELKGNKPVCLRSSNSYHLVSACQVGLRSPIAMAAAFRKHMMQGLVPRAKCDVVQLVRNEFAFDLDNLEDAKHMILSQDSTSLVGVWSMKQFIRQRLQEIHIEPTERVDSVGNIKLNTKANDVVHAFDIQRVTSLCWAPRSEDSGKTSRILFTTSSVLGDGDNMARVCDIGSEGRTHNDFFSVGPKATWACTWNKQGNQFSVGTESCSMLIDKATRRLWELYSGNCPVYSLQISQTTGQTMYSGTRRGCIFTHDLRSRSTLPVSSMSHKHAIAHLYLSTDENVIIASDVSAKVKKWDLRQRKVVHEYLGHINQYIRQPFHVDQAENLLFAVGQDCYTRIWCYRTGSLLHTLPSPYPVSIDSVPVIAYSDNMGGHGGLPGLLMACKNEFHLYSL